MQPSATASPSSLTNLSLAEAIKERAQQLGFTACGITAATPANTHPYFLQWLARGFYAGMQWIARPDAAWKRADVRRVLPEAKSVVCVAMHYRTDAPWDEEQHGLVARYARGTDYHDVMTTRLRELLAWIREQEPCTGRVYVDTGPLLERELAQRAGLGWVGKNTMLLSRELGHISCWARFCSTSSCRPIDRTSSNFVAVVRVAWTLVRPTLLKRLMF
jgi:epoxyqueuosine reductase